MRNMSPGQAFVVGLLVGYFLLHWLVSMLRSRATAAGA